MKGFGEIVENIMLYVRSFCVTRLVVGISMKGHADLYRLGNDTMTPLGIGDRILRPTARPYTSAVGPSGAPG